MEKELFTTTLIYREYINADGEKVVSISSKEICIDPAEGYSADWGISREQACKNLAYQMDEHAYNSSAE